MSIADRILIGGVMLAAASPAFAGIVPAAPGPEAGVGIAALAVAALGYRYLRRRSGR